MKQSHKFAQERWEVIKYLQPQLNQDKAHTQAQYKVRIAKVIAEQKGSISERRIKRPDGKEIVARVVNFPDGSYSRAPKDSDLETVTEFKARVVQR